MITRARWRQAQEREAQAWRRMGDAPRPYLELRGEFLEAWLRFHAGGRPPRRILEVGGAGVPAVDFFREARSRHSIDPLMREYARCLGRTSGVAARGEELPYPDGSFDAVLMLNVIDHTQDPARCLAEAARVLVPGGLLLLSCNVYTRAWLLLRAARLRLFGLRNNDVLHPHHFTCRSLLALCERGFRLEDAALSLADPLAREDGAVRLPRSARDRLKGEARLYVVGRPC